jgi:protein-disulfide isomerase
VKSGVTGTPMFYLNGTLYDESYDYDTVAAAIESLI